MLVTCRQINHWHCRGFHNGPVGIKARGNCKVKPRFMDVGNTRVKSHAAYTCGPSVNKVAANKINARFNMRTPVHIIYGSVRFAFRLIVKNVKEIVQVVLKNILVFH